MDSDFEDLFEDDDEEIIMYINRPYTVRLRPNHIDIWDDFEFKNRFRLSKEIVNNLLIQISPIIEHRTEKNYAVPPMLQLLLALRYYATGNMYISTGDFGGIHKTTAGKIIKRVTRAIADLYQTYIYMPRNIEEQQQTQTDFYNVARFPTVIGAVDGTHIRIISPGGPEAENFRNRKGYFSLNVQVVSNANYEITDLVARWPGSSHDSTIFDHSGVRARFERNEFQNSILLGDSAYALRSYLMTPLANPTTPAENMYNESHIRTRTIVERCFGIWKRRFPVLSVGMRCKLPLTQDIIIATAILHNIARRENLPEDPEELNQNYEDVARGNINNNNNVRNNVQNNYIDYFRTLI